MKVKILPKPAKPKTPRSLCSCEADGVCRSAWMFVPMSFSIVASLNSCFLSVHSVKPLVPFSVSAWIREIFLLIIIIIIIIIIITFKFTRFSPFFSFSQELKKRHSCGFCAFHLVSTRGRLAFFFVLFFSCQESIWKNSDIPVKWEQRMDLINNCTLVFDIDAIVLHWYNGGGKQENKITFYTLLSLSHPF